jgi:hypothetical protein
MTHDELLEEITAYERRTCNSAQDDSTCVSLHPLANALRAVVELHKNNGSKYTLGYGQVAIELCEYCRETYPCLTIQAIEKELN